MLSYKKDFFSLLAQTSPAPVALEIKSAEGIYLKDITGKRYMDLISGIAVSNLGHSHPHVIKAIKEQAGKYTHLMVYGEYVQSPQVKFAKNLCAKLPGALNSVYFVNSGAEAVEGALKLAKRYTGRTEIISFKNAYHGSTHGALSVMGDETLKEPFRPLLPNVRILNYGEKQELKNITINTACVIIEPIQGEAGIILPDKEFIKNLSKRCKETSTLLIFDEIQTGFGRTGKLFAFEHYGVTPDILLLGKALGGGLPLGTFITNRNIMSCISHDPALGHITTFGGHPLSCASGYAAFQVLLKSKLAQSVSKKEKLFRTLLKHKAIREIRGKGLMLALQLSDETFCKKVIETCLKNGIIVDWFLFCPSAIRLAPPLIISEKEIKQACTKIISSIEQSLS
jgi:acetylornithine/succinyldiaminopimelate/putrescine aminotransferase